MRVGSWVEIRGFTRALRIGLELRALTVWANFLKNNSSIACRPGLLKWASRVDFLGGGCWSPWGAVCPDGGDRGGSFSLPPPSALYSVL